MKKNILVSFLLFASLFASSQKEANVWCFGFNAGLDFNSGSPVALNNVQISTQEGCASIADKTTGRLLFYTDGINVWDSTNNIMPGSSFPGLLGNWSATESAVCVPLPGSTTQYYIFTVDAQAGNPAVSLTGYGGVAYSIVDMTLNGGLGDISVLNTQLLTPTSEKIAAVRHCNGSDIWIVIHQWNTNAFYAYALTSAGLQPPVITNIGIVHQDVGSGFAFEAIGYMKFSPNGQKLALACFNDLNLVQIFDFDNSTGVVSNPITDTNFSNDSIQDGPYGVSFSPDNSKLYVGAGNVDSNEYSHIYQYNMLAGDSAAILASRTTILTDSLDLMGGIQIGPDGKMYVAKESLFGVSSYLDVINYPDSLGAACGYVSNGIYLGNVGESAFGLPDIIQSYLSNPITATLTYADCSGDHTVSFTDNQLNGTIKTSWNFGDATSGTSDTSSVQNPTHTFSSSGSYNVTIYFSTACQIDSFTQTIATSGDSSASAGPDTSICSGNYVQLQASPGSSYIWSPSTGLSDSTVADPFAIPLATTTYTVTVTSGSCNSTATVTIDVNQSPPTPTITQSGDTLTCSYDPTYTAYQWYDSTTLIVGATASSYIATHSGNYNISVSNENGCSIAVGITIIIIPNGIQNYSSSGAVSVSPNPVTGIITIHISSPFTRESGMVKVMNVLGEIIYESQITNQQTEIDLSALASGIYFVSVMTENEKWIGKVIKE